MEKLNQIKAKILKGQILRSVEGLPLMSQSASKLMQAVADKEHSIHDVIEIVKYDPSLTVKILQGLLYNENQPGIIDFYI